MLCRLAAASRSAATVAAACDGAAGAAVARTDFSTWESDPLGLETVPLAEPPPFVATRGGG